MRILVTGGAGFIGSNLTEALLKLNNEVICLDNFATGKKENITVHYKEPFEWCVENRENNTFTLNILFFCDSCFQKFEQREQEKTGE
mgnify:CR=1 FL=1